MKLIEASRDTITKLHDDMLSEDFVCWSKHQLFANWRRADNAWNRIKLAFDVGDKPANKQKEFGLPEFTPFALFTGTEWQIIVESVFVNQAMTRKQRKRPLPSSPKEEQEDQSEREPPAKRQRRSSLDEFEDSKEDSVGTPDNTELQPV